MAADFEARVEAVRRFNRVYTPKIGVLGECYLDSDFSLVEVRVLYELAHREALTASVMAKELGLDPGYLSRILRKFERGGLIARRQAIADRRQHLVTITAKGRKTFAPLEARSHAGIAAMLGALPAPQQERLVGAMATIERLLGAPQAGEAAPPPEPYLLRPHQPGDLGWIVHRHAVLYAEEYGWDETFEAMVAEIAVKFIRDFDPRRERCWIAEKDGAIVGSVALVAQSATVAKLRLLLVEPAARGLGLGRRLVDECTRFARRTGYRKITLWTNDILTAARAIYVSAGYRLVKSEPHRSFGKDLVGENWELTL